MLKTVGFPSTRTGDQTIVAGNLVIGTAAKGVNFTANTPAAGMTNQLLDWYEEGTWTPTVKGDITAGTATYGAQGGSYTKIGNKVTCWFSVLNFSQSGAVGAFTVAGLPFTCITTSAVRGCFGGNLRFYNMDFPNGYDVPSTNLDDNADSNSDLLLTAFFGVADFSLALSSFCLARISVLRV